LPSARGWAAVGGVTLAAGAALYPFGVATGYLRHEVAPVGGAAGALKVVVGVLVLPAAVEEAVFRAALLPHPALEPTVRLTAAASAAPLAVFVAWHVLNPAAPPEARSAFLDTRFLTMAAVLGAACTAGYWMTGGSLLAAVVVHWMLVVVWLLALGGHRRLTAREQ